MSEVFIVLGGVLLGTIPIVVGSILVGMAINAGMQKR